MHPNSHSICSSSASTKLIHGGLRYLEHFEWRLVRESLAERERLLNIAPHLVHPLQFVLPHINTRRPRWMIRTGLFLYDHLGARQRLPASRSARRTDGLFTPLKAEIERGFTYPDCWVDDSRLVIANAMDAAARGAQIFTRSRFISADVRDGCWIALVQRAHEQDSFDVRARVLINAAGPWAERLLTSIPQTRTDSRVRLVKGSHIVTQRLYDAPHAYLLQHSDGRVVFTIPFEQEYTLIGTTDTAFSGEPASAKISPSEVRYLCDAVNTYFKRQIAPEDVRWTYAGVRPLLDDEATDVSRITRDYRLEFNQGASQPPLLSIFGGKLTTYRKLAETVLEKLHTALPAMGPAWTDRCALPGGDIPLADFARFESAALARWPSLPKPLLLRFARTYGANMERVLHGATTLADLGAHIGGTLTQREVEYLRAHEWAASADDILWRRTKLGLHMSAAECARLEQEFVSYEETT